MNPYVSVIIPIFNRTEMGLRAVRSVLSQSFRDFELIVVNDGSTEDLSQLRDFVERSNGFFIEQSNNGVAAARNAGAETARGRWLAFLDSDDAWEKRKL
ncbi:MAG TPA: glycosyltransferase family 2 protein, partial [Oligoflexia bacterium]|nr:glycosyltransferase family 2 protein [Oligoflexia bacterium]